jgi:hypothetical protein
VLPADGVVSIYVYRTRIKQKGDESCDTRVHNAMSAGMCEGTCAIWSPVDTSAGGDSVFLQPV